MAGLRRIARRASLVACWIVLWTGHADLRGAVWKHFARGQMFDCNGAAAGGEYQWPDNSLWSQQEVRGTDLCGNPDVLLEPSNWNGPFYPDNGNAGLTYDVVLVAPANTLLDILATIDTLTVQSDGRLEMLGGSQLNIVESSLVNDGTIVVNSDGGPVTLLTFFSPTNSGVLSGSGQIVLNEGWTGSAVGATFSAGGSLTTQSAGHTIRGKGSIVAALTNNGLIEAADTSGSGDPLLRLSITNQTNNNILRANLGATLRLQEIALTQDPVTGRLIGAGDSDPDPGNLRGNVELGDGAHIIGGRLEGDIDITDGTVTLENVVNLSARLDSVPGTTTNIRGPAFTNQGTFHVTSPLFNQFTHLRFLDDTLLTGTGELVLGQFNAVRVAAEPGVTVTNDTDHTISGQGKWFAPLVNNGVVEGFSLGFQNTTIQNNTTMATVPGGGISMVGVTVTQDAVHGQLLASQGGSMNLDTSTIINGRLEDTPSLTAFSGFRVSNLRLIDVHNLARVNVLYGTTLRVEGAVFTNDGPLTVNNDALSLFTAIEFQDSVALEGSGEILLNKPGTAALLRVIGGGNLTQAATHTIRGAGQIDANLFTNHGAVTNLGVVNANVDNDANMTALGEINGNVFNEGTLSGGVTRTLQVNGTLSGTGPLGFIQVNGTHAPGPGTAAIAVTGGYAIGPAGTLAIDLGGTTSGTEYDAINVQSFVTTHGLVALDGTLSVELTDLGGGLFIPSVGDKFTIITANPGLTDSVIGTFDAFDLPLVAGGRGLTWQVHYNPGNVMLELLAALLGDYDGNRVVDANDYTVWRDTLGSQADLRADANQNGIVDQPDYDAWVANFGAIAGSGAGSASSRRAALPEPGSVALWLSMAAAVSSLRWRASATDADRID